MGGPENGYFLLLYVVKMSLRRWVVQKSLKTPLRNIKMAPNFTGMKIKSFEWLKLIRNYEKKIMLGTSDTWSMSHLSHLPSEPMYYIEDCRISRVSLSVKKFARKQIFPRNLYISFLAPTIIGCI